MEVLVFLQENSELAERLVDLIERCNKNASNCLGGKMLPAFQAANSYQLALAREICTELLDLKQEILMNM